MSVVQVTEQFCALASFAFLFQAQSLTSTKQAGSLFTFPDQHCSGHFNNVKMCWWTWGKKSEIIFQYSHDLTDCH